jgi:hypothetical protein
MENEYGLRVYRKLLYFFQNEQAIHFTLLDTGEFYNGLILDLNEKKLTLVLKEFKLGEIPFLLEDINEDSIAVFTTKKEGDGKNDS